MQSRPDLVEFFPSPIFRVKSATGTINDEDKWPICDAALPALSSIVAGDLSGQSKYQSAQMLH